MVTQDTINRINELYRKSKAEGLTSAEAEEQKQLRAEYVAAFRNNLRGTLDSIKIQNPDGSITIPEVLVPYMGGKRKIEKSEL